MVAHWISVPTVGGSSPSAVVFVLELQFNNDILIRVDYTFYLLVSLLLLLTLGC